MGEKKKKKYQPQFASTAFDSNIISNEEYLHALFTKNEFESVPSDIYLVYVENLKKSGSCHVCLKYFENFELARVSTMPIKWSSIDIRNMDQEETKNSRDIRFSLLSEKLITDESSQKYQECVIKILKGKYYLLIIMY